MVTSSKITRRAVLAGIASAPLARLAEAAEQSPNLFQVLASPVKNQQGQLVPRRLIAYDGDMLRGEELNVRILRSLRKCMTVSVSQIACESATCPFTNQKLARLGENPDLVHLVINNSPELEGGFTPRFPNGQPKAMAGFLERLRDTFGIKGRIITVFPPSTTEAQQVMRDLKIPFAIVDGDYRVHLPTISLYEPDGELVERRNGVAQNLDGWDDKIKRITGRTR